MTEHVLLIGAEDVRSAGHTMARAAETMSSAASTIDGALDRQRVFMDDWLMRFEQVLDRLNRRDA